MPVPQDAQRFLCTQLLAVLWQAEGGAKKPWIYSSGLLHLKTLGNKLWYKNTIALDESMLYIYGGMRCSLVFANMSRDFALWSFPLAAALSLRS